ncbi:MAG TPA: metallopeptidase family protein [Gemmatimonadales bacterium]|nr:metallopeptidase family protein [Gemmatimonadales bacterium]
MRQDDFERMIRRMEQEVPAEFLAGVAEIAVSPRTVPHPTRDEIFTLGECIPFPAVDGASEGIQSRVVLYYGSFQALARIAPGFDWRAEAWETLTHELRHHLEWRARAPDLEAYDRAAEHNFARQDGEAFDPLFFLDGDPAGPDWYQVDDDVFLDVTVDQAPAERRLLWRGRVYRIEVPRETTLPAFLTVEGVAEPPEGEMVLVLRRPPGLRDLLRRSVLFQAAVRATEVYVSPDPTQIPQR